MTTERLDIVVTERGTKTVSRNIKNVGREGKKAGGQVDFLRRALFLLGGAAIIRKIIGLADSFVLLTNQIKVVSGETGNLADTTQKLFDISNRTRTAIANNVQLFQRLSFASKELGASQADLFKFVEQTGKLLAIQGGSAQAARGALIQLTQAMGSGIVRGEEFNSILEGAFSVALAAAKGLDRAGGSVSKLRTLIIKGKVTSEEFFRAILSQSKETDRVFGRTVATIGQSFNILENAAIKFFGELGQSTGIITRMATAVQLLAANFKDVSTAVAIVAGVLLVKLATVAIPAVIAGIATLTVAMLPLLAATALVAFGAIATEMAISGKSVEESLANIGRMGKKVFKGLADSFSGGRAAADEFGGRLFDFSNKLRLLGGVSEVSKDKVRGLLTTLSDLRGEINRNRLVQKFINPTSNAVKELESQLLSIDKIAGELEARILKPAEVRQPKVEPIKFTKGQISALRAIRDELDPVGAAFRNVAAAEKILSEALDAGKLTVEDYSFLMDNLATKSLADVRSALEEVNPALKRQRELLESIKAPAKDYAETIKDLGKLLEDGAISQEKFTALQRDAKITMLDSQTTVAAGAERAFLKMRRDVEDFAASTEELITNAFGAAEDAIVKFAQTGKFEFGDFVRQISADLLRLGTREAFGALTGAKGGGGGIGGLFNGLISGGGSGIGSLISGLFGFQHGGSFTVGSGTSVATIPGADNRLVAIRARDGENVTVTPRGQEPGGGRALMFNFNFPPGTDVNSFRRSQGQIAARTAAGLSRFSKRNN